MEASLAHVAFVALCCAVITTVGAEDVNPCKRQPFRGRCPSVKGKIQSRSQFVLRYYLRNDECVSYPFGHCTDDEDEPKLYRYKEECEEACLGRKTTTKTTGTSEAVDRKSSTTLASDEGSGSGSDTGDRARSTLEPLISSGTGLLPARTTSATPRVTSRKQLTECQQRKQTSESSLNKSSFTPVCSADGSFRPLQCETLGEQCFCVDRNGAEIPHSRSSGAKKPDCSRITEAKKPTTHECAVPLDPGPCSSALPRWYYDEKQQHCIQFHYSGCGGNGNNYATKAACENRCATSAATRCSGGAEPLKTANGAPTNCAKKACPSGYLCSIIQFSSVCCPANISKEIGAPYSDLKTNVCQLPKERGPCDRYELRFYYNNRLGECKYFFYGGCEGNANNFERVEECERTCRQHTTKTTAGSVKSAPQLITQGPQLKKVSKEFTTKSIKRTGEDNELEESTGTTGPAVEAGSRSSSIGSTDIASSSSTGITDDTTDTITSSVEQVDTSTTTAGAESTIPEKNLPTTGAAETAGTATSDSNRSTATIPGKVEKDDQVVTHQERTVASSPPPSTGRAKGTETEEAGTGSFSDSDFFIGSSDTFNEAEQKSVATATLSPPRQSSKKTQTSEQITIPTTPRSVETVDDVDNLSRAEGRTSLLSSVAPSTSKGVSLGRTTTATQFTSTTTTTSTSTSTSISTAPPQPTESKPSFDTAERCLQQRDRGTCAGQFIRWHWDAERRTCQVFTYSGCGGNGNNFASREECFSVCHRPVSPPQPAPELGNICEHSIDPGDCTGVFQRFAFDASTSDCRPFTYSGCGGNGNNFGSALECRNKCIKQRAVLPADVCQHPIEVGECSGVFPRFAYDLVTNECRSFTYGGCGGNGNNFGTLMECRTMCVRGQSFAPTQCPLVDVSQCVEPCILFSNRRGCQECICPVAQQGAEDGLAEPPSDQHDISSQSHPSALDAPSGESKASEEQRQNAIENENELFSSTSRSHVNSVTELGEKCTQPVDPGPCKNSIERWFFDVESGLCQSFQYGGCAGNRNHFFSKHECEIHCARFLQEIRKELRGQSAVRPEDVRLVHKTVSEGPNKPEIFGPPVIPASPPPAARGVASLQQLQPEEDDTCVLPPDAGSCFDYVPRWFYNSQTGRCEQFSYGSCGGNTNNFLERHTCEAKCAQGGSMRSQLPERCTFEKDEGSGGGYNVKWYFNIRNLRCEQMVYQGEGGNSNQFQTLGECQAFCTPVDGKFVRVAETGSKQIVQPSNQQEVAVSAQAAHRQEMSVSSQVAPQKGTLLEHEQQRQQLPASRGVVVQGLSQHAAQGIPQYTARNQQSSGAVSGNQIEHVQSGPEQYAATSSLSVQPPALVTPAQPSSYHAEPLDYASQLPPAEVIAKQKPLLGSSPPMEVNYQNGSRASGTKTLTAVVAASSTASSFSSELKGPISDTVADALGPTPLLVSNSIEDVARVPNCPNGLKPMQYVDGRPVMCLPGRNQCPDNSVCFFNGVDFFCCPNAEDPYDLHVFGGYGGEEVKHGYKSKKKAPLNINELIVRKKRLRLKKRQVPAFSIDQITRPVRLDSKLSQFSLAKASPVVSSFDDRHVVGACLQDIDTGKCTEAHLRYFYDRRANACRLFYYSGCGGNENNFATETDCRQQCTNANKKVEDASPGTCPYGQRPLGDNAPVLCGNETESFDCPVGYYCRMGPPHVCCPQEPPPDLHKILAAKKNSKDIRFAPHVSEVGGVDFRKNQYQNLRGESEEQEGQLISSSSKNSLLSVPATTCPDGSDALLDEFTHEPLKCGAGFDGESLCPVGYYCSIDFDKSGRLCCPLGMVGIKIPPPPIVPPFFGLRPSNPGEVIPRGSLPSDTIPEKHATNGSVSFVDETDGRPQHGFLSAVKLATDVEPLNSFNSARPREKEETDSSEGLVAADHLSESSDQDEPYGRMMLKAKGKDMQSQAFYNALGNTASSDSEPDGVLIDVGEPADPFESPEYSQKSSSDRSICHLKPTEGRTCREDEPPPRTNLQYFYSRRDKRCKLYFYRGCGGNQNRFDTKRHCELTCKGV